MCMYGVNEKQTVRHEISEAKESSSHQVSQSVTLVYIPVPFPFSKSPP